MEFSRAILNSPLLRRRNKHRSRNSMDSSEDDEGLQYRQTPKRTSEEDRNAGAAADGGGGGDNCYENLETFQKHQLKQKVRMC